MYANFTENNENLDNLTEINLASCRGDSHAYMEKQTAVVEELLSMDLQPDQ